MPKGTPTPAPTFKSRSLDHAGAAVGGELVAAGLLLSGLAIAVVVGAVAEGMTDDEDVVDATAGGVVSKDIVGIPCPRPRSWRGSEQQP